MRRLATVDAMLVATVLMWAFNVTVTKYVLTHGFRPLAYSVLRYGLAAIIFGALTIAIERTLRIRGRRDWLLLGAAILVLALNQVCFVYALTFTTATTASLVLGSTPIFVAFVAVGAEGGITRLSADLKGVLLTLGMAGTWAAYSVTIAPLMRRYSPYRISSIVLVGTWIPLLLVGLHQTSRQDWDLGWLVWLGVAAAIFALLLLDESVTMVQVAGGLAIGAGIALSRGPATPVPRGE